MNEQRIVAGFLVLLVVLTANLLGRDIRVHRKKQPGRVVLAGVMFCIALDMLLSFWNDLPP